MTNLNLHAFRVVAAIALLALLLLSSHYPANVHADEGGDDSIVLTATATDQSATITWNLPVTGYINDMYLERLDENEDVERSVWIESDLGGDEATSWEHSDYHFLVAGTTYRYRVKLETQDHGVVYSDVLSVTTQTEPPVPPTGLSATATHEAVSLTWTVPQQPAWVTESEPLSVMRSAFDGRPVLVGSVPWQQGVTEYSFTDTDVISGTTYGYFIRSYMGAGLYYSEEVSVTTAAQPEDPDGTREGATVLDADAASEQLQELLYLSLNRNGGDSVDYYTFTTTARHWLTFGVWRYGPHGNDRIHSGVALEGADGNTKVESSPPPADSTKETLETAIGPGTYYVRVEAIEDGLYGYFVYFGLTEAPPNNTPAFGSATYNFSVAEDAATGAAVGEVSGTDADDDSLTYSITAGNSDAKFAIDRSTGAITTAGTLDHETTPSYTLTVQADDGNGGTATATVNVTVMATRYYAQSTRGETEQNSETVSLNIDWGKFIQPPLINVALDGLDRNVNYVLSTRISSDGTHVPECEDSGFGDLEISDSEEVVQELEVWAFCPFGGYTLEALVKTDDEVAEPLVVTKWDFSVRTTFTSGLMLFLYETVTFEHFPLEYRVSLPNSEMDSDPDTVEWVVRVDVVDLDGNDVNECEAGHPWAEFGVDHEINIVDERSEKLAFRTSLRCPVGHYMFRTTVHDGYGTLMGDALGIFTVQAITVPVPNSPPEFGSSSYEFSIAEDAAVGAAVGSVSATDADNDSQTYSITTGNGDGVFAIDGGSGAITTAGALDHETTPSYTLTVQADDGNGGTATATVNVTVIDVDENSAPSFGSSTYSFSIAEDAATGAAVGSVSATDADNDGITYTIEAGNGDGVFAIDGGSGAITTAGTLDHETDASYTLTVQADDGNGGTDTATVNVTVTDVAEDPDGTREGAVSLGDQSPDRGRQFFRNKSLDRANGDGVDYYTFTTDGRYVLGLGVRDQSIELKVTLEDAEGNVVGTAGPPLNPDLDQVYIEWLKITIDAGTYYIRVEALADDATGYYIRFGLTTP